MGLEEKWSEQVARPKKVENQKCMNGISLWYRQRSPKRGNLEPMPSDSSSERSSQRVTRTTTHNVVRQGAVGSEVKVKKEEAHQFYFGIYLHVPNNSTDRTHKASVVHIIEQPGTMPLRQLN